MTNVLTSNSRNAKNLIIVGNGMAAGRLIDEIQKRKGNEFNITIIGDEPQGSYNRIMLSPVLVDEVTQGSIIQKDRNWYTQHNMTFHAGRRVVVINSSDKHVQLDTGEKIAFDECVIATGSSPTKIPAANQQLNNILAFRTIADVETIKTVSENIKSAIVVGGGLLGLEAAYGLAQRNVQVTLIHRSPWLLNRQLDNYAGNLLRKKMELLGVRFQLHTEVESFNSLNGQDVSGASLKNGQQLDCELAIIATGITPNAKLSQHTGLACNRATIVDSTLNTSISNISALGECCEFEGNTFGLVDPIWHQCRTLADRLICNTNTPFSIQPTATKLKVSGVQLFSAGEHITQPHHRELIMQDPSQNVYRKLLLDNNRIVGIVLFGDTRDGNFYFDLMQQQTDVSAEISGLVFGKQFCTNLPTENALPCSSKQKVCA